MLNLRIALLLLVSFLAAPVASAMAPQEIVAAADRLRNPGRPVSVATTVIAYRGGKAVDKNVFTVFSKIDPATGQFRDIVVYREPPRDAGKMMLFNAAFLWFFDPASKDSVRISPQQQLIGQANAGDVLLVNFAVDYKAASLGDETIADGNSKQRKCAHLDLRPANADAIYNRIEYWVEQPTNIPVKVKFYSDSGRLMKILYYRNTKQGPADKISQAVILDAIDTSLVTTIDFGEPRPMDIPDAWFQRDYLPHLKID